MCHVKPDWAFLKQENFANYFPKFFKSFSIPTGTQEIHYKAQLVAVNVKFLRDKSVPYSHQEEVATVKERVAKGSLDANKQYQVTSATVSQKYRDVDYTLPRRFVSAAKYRYQ